MIKISALVATRNRENLIRGCLDSLVSQTVAKNLEIVVIDGNSKQKEKNIVKDYQKKYPFIKYIFLKKLGLYHAWNIGIKNSAGKYITTLNTDDRLKKNALEIMSKTLDAHPSVAMVYGNSYITTSPDETFEKNSSKGKHFNLPKYSHKELLMYCVCGPHPMWRKKLHSKIGYFDESYKILGDYDFWLRIAEKYNILNIPKIIGLYYLNPKGLSTSNSEILIKKEKLRLKQKYFHCNYKKLQAIQLKYG